MGLIVGDVVAVAGVRIVLRIFEESSKDTLFYRGKKYKGVSIREHLLIRRGFRDIVCLVEGEYLDHSKFEKDGNKIQYIRKVELKPIGYLDEGAFHEGIKYLPMIGDPAELISEENLSSIYSRSQDGDFLIGKMLKEDLPVSLPWSELFNTHIGILGNTGSGKSNTLAKLYTVLFDRKKNTIRGKSTFALIDFNGEYTSEQLIHEDDKSVINLSTRSDDGDKFKLPPEEFWDIDVLRILFKATPNTQVPFLNRVIKGKKKYENVEGSLLRYIKATIKNVFVTVSPKRDSLNLVKSLTSYLQDDELSDLIRQIKWHGNAEKFYANNNFYFNGGENEFNVHFGDAVSNFELAEISPYDEILIRSNLQLINDLQYGFVQFDFIQPLLKRVESAVSSLAKVIQIDEEIPDEKILTVISLRNCNQDTKKIVPLLLAKYYYNRHKNLVSSPPDSSFHLIVDEAHNVLSEQSMRELEDWKDYRLELFEEIIKEGRKFGMYLTVASQRPADISPTIISQIHNFFIHRLVNDKDLYLIDKTISTLDALSKSLIPNLSKGSCVITGTSFPLPIVMQIDLLPRVSQPDSVDVDLSSLWANQEEDQT